MSDEEAATAIKIEKRLCGALMRQWSPAGMSVETLASDAANAIERLRAVIGEYLAADAAVEAEAKRVEKNGGNGWSSAPVVRRLNAVEEMRAALSHQQLSGGADATG